MMEALYSSEMSGLTRAIRSNFPEDAIPHSHRRENLKSYKDTGGLTVDKLHGVVSQKVELSLSRVVTNQALRTSVRRGRAHTPISHIPIISTAKRRWDFLEKKLHVHCGVRRVSAGQPRWQRRDLPFVCKWVKTGPAPMDVMGFYNFWWAGEAARRGGWRDNGAANAEQSSALSDVSISIKLLFHNKQILWENMVGQ
jgi:hypothetical protein